MHWSESVPSSVYGVRSLLLLRNLNAPLTWTVENSQGIPNRWNYFRDLGVSLFGSWLGFREIILGPQSDVELS